MINNPTATSAGQNKGYRTVGRLCQFAQDWSLSIMGNYSFNRNKVLEDDSTVAYPWQKTIGNKVDQRFGLIALGLFESRGDRRSTRTGLATRARATSATRTSTATARSTNTTSPSARGAFPRSSTASDSP